MDVFIYVIENSVNNKLYVGQTRNVSTRMSAHKSNNSGAMILSYAIRKHGKNNFFLSILEKCSPFDEANIRERFWISELNTLVPFGYNVSPGGMNASPSESSRMKMSLWQAGKSLSDEHKLKISVSLKGRAISSEHRKKIALGKLQDACGEGHLFTEENTKFRLRVDGRVQRTCRNKRERDKYHLKKTSGSK